MVERREAGEFLIPPCALFYYSPSRPISGPDLSFEHTYESVFAINRNFDVEKQLVEQMRAEKQQQEQQLNGTAK